MRLPWRHRPVIAGRVNADGSIAAGDGFTVQRPAIGFYDVTLPQGFQLLGWSASVTTSTLNHVATGSGTTSSTFRVIVFSVTNGNPADVSFSFVAVGA